MAKDWQNEALYNTENFSKNSFINLKHIKLFHTAFDWLSFVSFGRFRINLVMSLNHLTTWCRKLWGSLSFVAKLFVNPCANKKDFLVPLISMLNLFSLKMAGLAWSGLAGHIINFAAKNVNCIGIWGRSEANMSQGHRNQFLKTDWNCRFRMIYENWMRQADRETARQTVRQRDRQAVRSRQGSTR